MAKKLFALILALMLVVSLAIPALAAETPVADTGDSTITVKFSDALLWGSPNIYYWPGGADWPGTPMDFYETNEYDEAVYTATIPAGITGIVFNGEGNQTVDILTNLVDGAHWYTKNELEGANYKVGYVAPSAQPTEAPAEPTTASGKAVVSIYGTDGVVADTQEFDVGDTFTVYTSLDASQIYDGKIASLSCTQNYTASVLSLTDSLTDGEFDDLTSVFPVTGNVTVSNAGDPGVIRYNATTGSFENSFVFASNRDYLIKTTYEVTYPGYAEVTNAIKTLASADAPLTKIVNKGTVYNNNFTVAASFEPAAEPVTELAIIDQPADWEGNDGETASFSVNATGDNLSYQWYYRNAGKTNWISVKEGGNTPVYEIGMNSMRDGREVYCVVTDGNGNSVESNIATMSYAVVVGPVITQQPQNWTGFDGQTATFTVAAQGEELTYQWFYRKAGATGNFAYANKGVSSTSYSVEMAPSREGREVFCQITDKYGNTVDSNIVTMSYAEAVGPVIISQPQNWEGNNGQLATFSVTAEGDNLTYQWFYRKAGATGNFAYANKGVSSPTYSIEMRSDRAGREIFCQITDEHGNTVDTDIVTMSYPVIVGPVITQQPQNWVGAKGAVTDITVVAEGEGLTYQWYYRPAGKTNWIAAADTDATYNVEMTNSRNGREVYCKITDSNGDATDSAVATMTIG